MLKRKVIGIVASLLTVFAPADARVIFVAPHGNDAAKGSIDAPLATLPAAYRMSEGGDTVYFRGGTYRITDEQVMKYEGRYAYVFALEKAGTASRRTCYMGYPGERPVFDFSALMLDGKYRFGAFYLGADYLHLRNFDIVGVPVRIKGHTQSECVSARKGSYCIIEDIAMHDGMAIGYYQKRGSHNLVVDCDAYNNYDDYSEGPYGGNVDSVATCSTLSRWVMCSEDAGHGAIPTMVSTSSRVPPQWRLTTAWLSTTDIARHPIPRIWRHSSVRETETDSRQEDGA